MIKVLTGGIRFTASYAAEISILSESVLFDKFNSVVFKSLVVIFIIGIFIVAVKQNNFYSLIVVE